MTRFAPWLIAASLSLIAAPSAQALCVYQGTLYARTTLQQEFADAGYVVKARVLSAVDGWPQDDVEGSSWTTYQLEVLTPFKGELPARFILFTERNSGGFYLDRNGGEPDVGGEYLLFLNSIELRPGTPQAARAGFLVNYSCGQSRPWREVDASAQAQLQALATDGAG
ncbi:hypothetical protein [Brevundimonas sp. FT23042]|uniref:hypothetical protein n=1 Tax=Brevundimonas sp. FT23042 TaxID=3393749 RepID=UPI003B5860F6